MSLTPKPTPIPTPPARLAEEPKQGHPAPPSAFRFFEVSFVVACIALDLRLSYDLFVGFSHDAPSMVAITTSIVAAYFACDLVAGLVHFALDRFGTVDTPYVGRTFLLPFRSHHVRPNEIRAHDFVETNGNNAFGALLLLVPYAVWGGPREGGAAAATGVFVLVFTLLVLLTNQFHKWAHDDSPPRLVAWLQRLGILISPTLHAVHHDAPHGGGYCVTSGVWNRLLDPLGFFPACERLIRSALGLARPNEE